VRENIVLASRKGQEAASFDRVRDKFPALANRFSQLAGSLSGGEQQMLSIARAFLSSPKVVAVDEASLGLSPAAVDRVYEALAEILAEGVALILVEQYVRRALNFADSVYVLTRGRVAFSGRADDLDAEDVLSRYLGDDAVPDDAVSASAGPLLDGAPEM
jgi:branched-chain amino acid transport system ATP-binding protein